MPNDRESAAATDFQFVAVPTCTGDGTNRSIPLRPSPIAPSMSLPQRPERAVGARRQRVALPALTVAQFVAVPTWKGAVISWPGGLPPTW